MLNYSAIEIRQLMDSRYERYEELANIDNLHRHINISFTTEPYICLVKDLCTNHLQSKHHNQTEFMYD